MSYIYSIGPKNGPIKIGYSKSPEKRIGELQTGCPEKLYLHYTAKVDDNKAEIIEHLIHRANNHKRINGEWFDLSIEDSQSEIEFALIRYSDDDSIIYKYRNKLKIKLY